MIKMFDFQLLAAIYYNCYLIYNYYNKFDNFSMFIVQYYNIIEQPLQIQCFIFNQQNYEYNIALTTFKYYCSSNIVILLNSNLKCNIQNSMKTNVYAILNPYLKSKIK